MKKRSIYKSSIPLLFPEFRVKRLFYITPISIVKPLFNYSVCYEQTDLPYSDNELRCFFGIYVP